MAGCHLAEIEDLRRQLTIARTEIKNIRQAVFAMKKEQKKEISDLKKLLQAPLTGTQTPEQETYNKPRGTLPTSTSHGMGDEDVYTVRPMAYMASVFVNKNGTPRQSGLCVEARGQFTILKSTYNNPQHALEGLQKFSHIWLLFMFHDNGEFRHHAKVRPPRLDGEKTGVLSTRSPHRPNPIGLTLAKLDHIRGATVYVSGIDLIHGTPILDIKPYIPQYDQPITEQHSQNLPITELLTTNQCQPIAEYDTNVQSSSAATRNADSLPNPIRIQESLLQPISDEESSATSCQKPEPNTIADWINKPVRTKVSFTPRALQDLELMTSSCLTFFSDSNELKQAIERILSQDPRSVYRRQSCGDRLYYFTVDGAHVTAWFDEQYAEVLRVKPVPTAL